MLNRLNGNGPSVIAQMLINYAY